MAKAEYIPIITIPVSSSNERLSWEKLGCGESSDSGSGIKCLKRSNGWQICD